MTPLVKVPAQPLVTGVVSKGRRYEPHVLAVVSGWEFAALVTGLVPTWTSLVRRLPRPARRLVAVAAGVYLWKHFE